MGIHGPRHDDEMPAPEKLVRCALLTSVSSAKVPVE
jgi:hypothetical protein